MMINETQKKRYLGLHLGGAKSDRTAVVVFDVFEEEEPKGGHFKRFLVDIFSGIRGEPEEGADENLLRIVKENQENLRWIGVDAPLSLPPCILCQLECPGAQNCSVEAVKWMRRDLEGRLIQPRRGKRHKPIAPYIERPVDVFLRQYLGEGFGQVAISEALGATTASKAGRMQYLMRHLKDRNGNPHALIEVNPTLSLALLKEEFNLTTRDLKYYRDLQEGGSVRMRILDRINEENKVFLYENDIGTLVSSLPAFYAFLCAYTAYLSDLGCTVAPEEGFPKESGWVAIPNRV